MKTEEGGKAFPCVKSLISSKQVAPTAVSDGGPLPCLPFCPMSQVAMVRGSQ